jgi:hypothetical protein
LVFLSRVYILRANAGFSSRRKGQLGSDMLEMFIGALVALLVFGLPLAIIALFITSTLERRTARAPESIKAMQPTPTSAFLSDYDKRRRIIYEPPFLDSARKSDPN